MLGSWIVLVLLFRNTIWKCNFNFSHEGTSTAYCCCPEGYHTVSSSKPYTEINTTTLTSTKTLQPPCSWGPAQIPVSPAKSSLTSLESASKRTLFQHLNPAASSQSFPSCLGFFFQAPSFSQPACCPGAVLGRTDSWADSRAGEHRNSHRSSLLFSGELCSRFPPLGGTSGLITKSLWARQHPPSDRTGCQARVPLF